MVLSGDKMEKMFGSFIWKGDARANAGKILGPNDPFSVRVQHILTKIIQALHDTLGLQHDCHVSIYVPKVDGYAPKADDDHHQQISLKIIWSEARGLIHLYQKKEEYLVPRMMS